MGEMTWGKVHSLSFLQVQLQSGKQDHDKEQTSQSDAVLLVSRHPATARTPTDKTYPYFAPKSKPPNQLPAAILCVEIVMDNKSLRNNRGDVGPIYVGDEGWTAR
jgi:hypothetical protein